MKDQRTVFISDRAFSGHVNVAGGHAELLAKEGADVNHLIIDPARELARIEERIADAQIVVQCLIPPLLKPLPGVRNIALVFHEWSRMPHAWARALTQFDDVWVSSEYNQQILAGSGYRGTPVIVPAHIDTAKFAQKDSWKASLPFRFLSVGEWHFRKGYHLLAEAFTRAFPPGEQVELHIKTSGSASFRFEDERITLLTDRLSENEMQSLYRQYDAYVTTSLAEGLGLPVAEAMAARLPVAAINWGGHTEFCGDGRSIDLPYSLSLQPYCSRPDYHAPGQQCAVAGLDGTASILRGMVNMEPADREKMTEKALDHIEQQCSAKVVTSSLKKALGY